MYITCRWKITYQFLDIVITPGNKETIAPPAEETIAPAVEEATASVIEKDVVPGKMENNLQFK